MKDTKKDFLKYILEQQGEDYIREQGYKRVSFQHLILMENEHYGDFRAEINKKWKQ